VLASGISVEQEITKVFFVPPIARLSGTHVKNTFSFEVKSNYTTIGEQNNDTYKCSIHNNIPTAHSHFLVMPACIVGLMDALKSPWCFYVDQTKSQFESLLFTEQTVQRCHCIIAVINIVD
jgi:hypothetical protein